MSAPLISVSDFSMFSSKDLSRQKPSKSIESWQDAGTVYQALALTISDTILSSPFSASQPGITKLIKAFFNRYPETLIQPVGMPFNDFKCMLQTAEQRPILIAKLSETLYSMTIEGIFQHPTRYHEFALPSEKREYPAHWIATSAPAVIADFLNLSICVSTIEAGKSLPASMTYEPPNAYKKTLHLRERHGRYAAGIIHKDLFQAILPAPTLPEPNQRIFAQLIERLEVEISQTLRKFNRIYNRMARMVDAGELSKEFLLKLYLENLSFQRLHGGTQAFFDSIHIEEADHSVHMMQELLHAIARMISLGDLEEGLIFTQIEMMDEPHEATRLMMI